MMVREEGRGGIDGRDNSVRCMLSGSTCRTPPEIALTYTTVLATGERYCRSPPVLLTTAFITQPLC